MSIDDALEQQSDITFPINYLWKKIALPSLRIKVGTDILNTSDLATLYRPTFGGHDRSGIVGPYSQPHALDRVSDNIKGISDEPIHIALLTSGNCRIHGSLFDDEIEGIREVSTFLQEQGVDTETIGPAYELLDVWVTSLDGGGKRILPWDEARELLKADITKLIVSFEKKSGRRQTQLHSQIVHNLTELLNKLDSVKPILLYRRHELGLRFSDFGSITSIRKIGCFVHASEGSVRFMVNTPRGFAEFHRLDDVRHHVQSEMTKDLEVATTPEEKEMIEKEYRSFFRNLGKIHASVANTGNAAWARSEATERSLCKAVFAYWNARMKDVPGYRPFKHESNDDIVRFISDFAPTMMGEYLAHFHETGNVLKYPHGQNWSLAICLLDLDSVSGTARGEPRPTDPAEYIMDVEKSLRSIGTLFGTHDIHGAEDENTSSVFHILPYEIVLERANLLRKTKEKFLDAYFHGHYMTPLVEKVDRPKFTWPEGETESLE